MLERRHTRSTDRQTALTLLLDACRERASASALVVADERGLLVAGSGSGDLASVAAYVGQGEGPVHHLDLGGYPLALSAVGGNHAALAAELAHAAAGTARILSREPAV